MAIEIQGKDFPELNVEPDVTITREYEPFNCSKLSPSRDYICTRRGNHLRHPYLHIAGGIGAIFAIWMDYETHLTHEEIYETARAIYPRLPSIPSLLRRRY